MLIFLTLLALMNAQNAIAMVKCFKTFKAPDFSVSPEEFQKKFIKSNCEADYCILDAEQISEHFHFQPAAVIRAMLIYPDIKLSLKCKESDDKVEISCRNHETAMKQDGETVTTICGKNVKLISSISMRAMSWVSGIIAFVFVV